MKRQGNKKMERGIGMKRKVWGMLCAVLAVSMLLTGCGKQCGVEDCKEKAIDGGGYCETHTCKAEGCLLGTVLDGDYCEDHTCAAENCKNEILTGSEYCEAHTCEVDGCFELVKADGTYCESHGCGKVQCPELKMDGSTFCEKHTCHLDGCGQETYGETPYCEGHKCGKVSCENLHIENSRYCEEHICKVDGCVNGVSGGHGYCKEHYAEKKAEMGKAAYAKLNKKYDKVEGITWYTSKTAPYYADTRSYVLPYIGMRDGGVKWLRLVFHYTGSDWIFFDRLTIMVDGEKYYKVFDYYDVVREVGGGKVWERADISADGTDIELLKKIADSNETIIRFQGDNHYYDLTVKGSDKTAIKEVLEAYSI